MKTTTFILFLFNALLSPTLDAQFLSAISFETEFTTRFSIRQETRETIVYKPGLTINYPRSASFRHPGYALEFAALVPLTPRFQSGIACGMAVAINEQNPVSPTEYFHRVMIPLTGRFRYTIDLPSQFEIVPEARIGYQFSNAAFGWTEDGYRQYQSGGIITGLEIGIAKDLGTWSPSCSVGYEINQIHNDVSLGSIEGYSYHDQYRFTTHYHLITLGIGLKM